MPREQEERDDRMRQVRENWPIPLRMLEDGTIIGLQQLITTVGLIIDINPMSWERRYCYSDPVLAIEAFNAMTHGDETPLPGYVSQRPKPHGEL
jgi:hypothetical protein